MITALVTDLFFQVRIRSTAASSGRQVQFGSSVAGIMEAAESADLLVVDLDVDDPDPVQLIRKVKNAHPDLRVIAFGPHVQKERLKNASEAGADEVLPRSRFTAELMQILECAAPDA